MTPEPQRLQYLDAMGLTAWVGRYQLPNALPTQACEWPEPITPEAVAPQARLHALIDEAPRPTTPPAVSLAALAHDTPARPAGPPPSQSARALLGMAESVQPSKASVAKAASALSAPAASASLPSEQGSTASWGTPPDKMPAPVEVADEAAIAPPADQSPLRFSLQIAALDGRWLVVLPGDEAPHLQGEALLKALWRAAGITEPTQLTFSNFRWPLLPNLKASAPLEEAQEGLRAFLSGPARRDWQPERLLVFGNDEGSQTLCKVLGVTSSMNGIGESSLLNIPVWHGPSLAALAHSSEAKRSLWPLLARWGRDWKSESATPGDSA